MKCNESNSHWRGRSRCVAYLKINSSPIIVQFLVLLATPFNADKIKSETQAVMYLSKYGYLSPRIRNVQSGQLVSDEMLSKAIMEFQAFANLNLTGYLDEDTMLMMSLPRCGVRDKVGVSTYSRSKRYALQGSRWKVKNLTYGISKYPTSISKFDTEAEISRAFSVWSDVSPLTFTKKSSGQVHIDIRFEVGEHGDEVEFDGPGGILAHAFFPIYGGDVHFDNSEWWSIRSHSGTNFFQVAVHELGHTLGLLHSDVNSALMAPFYRGYEVFFSLHSDDIEAIQTLYGSKSDGERPGAGGDEDDNSGTGSRKSTVTVKSTIRTDSNGDDSELCNDGSIDTIFTSADRNTYVFKGSHYWKLMNDGIVTGYPKLITSNWPELPSNIDAAFSYKNGKTYFFKGSKYWKYDGTKLDGDYPKEINEGFTGIPDNIDAASVWSGNGKIYFFKGSNFWRFDPTQIPPVKRSYPKPISKWEGIPHNLDDLLYYTNGYTYFFKGGRYWKFNDKTFAVVIADPPFPRNAAQWWFGCREESKNYTKKNKNESNSETSAGEYKPTSVDLWNEQRINQKHRHRRYSAGC